MNCLLGERPTKTFTQCNHSARSKGILKKDTVSHPLAIETTILKKLEYPQGSQTLRMTRLKPRAEEEPASQREISLSSDNLSDLIAGETGTETMMGHHGQDHT